MIVNMILIMHMSMNGTQSPIQLASHLTYAYEYDCDFEYEYVYERQPATESASKASNT